MCVVECSYLFSFEATNISNEGKPIYLPIVTNVAIHERRLLLLTSANVDEVAQMLHCIAWQVLQTRSTG